MFTVELPVHPSSVPHVAIIGGFADRYRYWQGQSGRSYLFTQVEATAAAEFQEAVAIAVRHGRIVWTGEAQCLANPFVMRNLGRCDFYVHLLAGEAEGRRLVIADLQGSGRPLAAAA